MAFQFSDLTPGRTYTITPIGGFTFTGAVSGADGVPGGVSFAGGGASLVAPAATASFRLGTAVSAVEVSLSIDFTGPEAVVVGLMDGRIRGRAGAITFKVIRSDLPPTCVALYPETPSCPVCQMDGARCPETGPRGRAFYVDLHRFLACVDCPDGC